MSFKVGQKVQIQDGRIGVVRFAGETTFKEGQWLGLELEEADGKNDGSVRGERYFDCPPNHGLFIQPSPAIEILEQPKPPAAKVANGKPTAPTPKARPSSMVSSTSTSRPRQSISAAPSKRTSLAPSAMAPPVSKTPVTPAARRQSVAPPTTGATRTSRPSLAPRALSPKKPSTSTSRQSIAGTSALGGRTALSRSPTHKSPSPGIDGVLSPGSSSSGGNSAAKPTAKPAVTAPVTSAAPKVSTLGNKAAQENEAKIRVLEKKVQEYRQRMQEMQPQVEKVERYEGVIQKLQTKAQSQMQENNELKKQLKQSETGFAQVETLQAEHDSMIEMATLDREMAEEKAESYKAELDSLKSRLEELELENEILKNENEELSKDMSPEERASQGWIQMQRENTRLREALLRLRDMTQEQEASLREEIELLEEDSQELDKVKEEYETTRTRLLETEAEIEDLREQLDAALGAETMIEELTEKNLEMSERIEDLRNEVEDLQALKEVNDELELNHIEHEKQLQEAIDWKESLLVEYGKKAIQLDEEVVDRDYTIQRFRELVTNMQSDIEDMRASKELTENEAQELGNHSRTMMDLNRQLQASAMSTKVKTIEMELRKLEAQEAAEQLGIVQLFLPEAFASERASVLALLRFKRIGFKSNLLHGFMKDRIISPSPHAGADSLLAACDALDKLTWVSAMSDRFVHSISTSSLEQFAKFESVLHELEPVERALNGYIENLRQDELQDQQVADGLQRAIAVLQHLSELHIRDTPENFADEVLMKTLLMQSNLETIATALQITKAELLRTIPTSEDGEDSISTFVEKTDNIAMQSRSARVIVGKVLRSIQDFKARGLALANESQDDFQGGQLVTQELTTSLRTLGLSLHKSIHAEDRAKPFAFSDLMQTMREFNSSQDADVFAQLLAKMKGLHDRLSDLYTISSDLGNTVEFEKPPTPWVLRSRALAESKIVSQDAQQEIAGLKREINERGTTIKIREQSLEEAGVKIELLEARMRDSGKKVARIEELESLVGSRADVEKRLGKALDEERRLRAKVEEDRDNWARKASEMKVNDATAKDLQRAGVDLVGTSREMEAFKSEIKTLESTIRFLRKEVRRTRDEELKSENSWLMTPLSLPATKKASHYATEQKSRDAKKAFNALADLPAIAKPLSVDVKERLKWKPRALTTRYQLCEAEMMWVETKELWAGVRAAPVVLA